MWIKIPETGIHSINEYGQIRNDNTGRILQTRKTVYETVCLYYNGKKHLHYVHRLVARAFIPTIDGKTEVDHINGNKLDNHVSNLRWLNRSENRMAYGYDICNKKKWKPVIARHKDGREIIFQSRLEAATYFSCDTSTIIYGREYAKGNKKGWTLELKI